MIACAACASRIPDESLSCPVCGEQVLAGTAAPTRLAPRPPSSQGAPSPPRPPSRPPSSSPFDQGRFIPGTLLADRYRVVGLVGKGGMGEVYRADDLKLGQVVALKFLPQAASGDASRLARFLGEVRLARQISHPNVCRLYDVAEVDGHHFLTMEYVDGEDLAGLLRRIGRLPQDKAIQIARELCAGLAAAHEQGILHRDLKPANVMIDGRGRARITDFGLAALADDVPPADAGAGTPAYMAPEQLAGQSANVRSDVYALGLVLYELFTGQTPFKGATRAERLRQQSESRPASPSSFVEGLNPVVERVILRCLAKDPKERPGSALAVAAALPGGDPLAAALAAGETPSPELVAEAGEAGGLSPLAAGLILAALAVTLAAVIFLSPRTQIATMVPLEKPPEVLVEKAREILRGAGAKPFDERSGFRYDGDYVDHIKETDRSPERWSRLRSGPPYAIHFWYRSSPSWLSPANRVEPKVRYEDPPFTLSGMTGVVLDPSGRLLRLDVVPGERETPERAEREPDWDPFLRAAGFDPGALTAVEPQWLPPYFADRRSAWQSREDETDSSVRIEAASYRGAPVSLRVVRPWTATALAGAPQGDAWRQSARVLAVVTILGCLFGASILARRNVRVGRADWRGASRVAAALLIAGEAYALLVADHTPEMRELGAVISLFSINLFFAAAGGVFYLALEPYLRRLWPRLVVSWVRLLEGRLRDPLVGRDVLAGLLGGVLLVLMDQLYHVLPPTLGWLTENPEIAVGPPIAYRLNALGGYREVMGMMFDQFWGVLVFPMGITVVLVLLRLLLRSTWAACLALMLVVAFTAGTPGPNPRVWVLYGMISAGGHLLLFFRFGLLTLVSCALIENFVTIFPMTVDVTAWYSRATVPPLLAIAVLATAATRVALGGRPLLKGDLLES